jgi:hypothetical protein
MRENEGASGDVIENKGTLETPARAMDKQAGQSAPALLTPIF